jgi:hypothetical protein
MKLRRNECCPIHRSLFCSAGNSIHNNSEDQGRLKHNVARRQSYALNHNRDPKGMGGAWRDDHPDNIQATHLVV